METSKIKLTEIEPADYNPRQISTEDMKKLKNSIRQFGLADPIVINTKNNRIISGHQRYKALLDIYMEDGLNIAEEEFVLISKGDLGFILTEKDLELVDENHEKALNIAINNISGEWDMDKLSELLSELNGNIDLELTGFDEYELDVFLDDDFEDLSVFEDIDDDFDEPNIELEELQDNQKDHLIVYISFVEMEKANRFLEIINHNTFFKENSFSRIVVDGDAMVDENYK